MLGVAGRGAGRAAVRLVAAVAASLGGERNPKWGCRNRRAAAPACSGGSGSTGSATLRGAQEGHEGMAQQRAWRVQRVQCPASQ